MKRELGLGRCGLACCVCSENTHCRGCNSGDCPCRFWCVSSICTREKGYDHCYECPDNCRQGMQAKIKPYGFTMFARKYGEEKLLDCLEANEKRGVIYNRDGGLNGDYDAFDDLEKLFHFILTGER